MTELPSSCKCGRTRWVASDVHPAVANRVVCSCRGCHAWAQRMDPDVLDDDGGTERFQVNPASLTLRQGAEHLACMQQTPRGALRWYASCCQTPIGLTLPSSRVPFVGLDVRRIDQSALGCDVAEVLGPLRARVNTTYRGAAARARKADHRSLLAMLWHLTPLVIRWWWRGAHKRSPFFRAGRPVVEPKRLYPTPRALLGTAGCR